MRGRCGRGEKVYTSIQLSFSPHHIYLRTTVWIWNSTEVSSRSSHLNENAGSDRRGDERERDTERERKTTLIDSFSRCTSHLLLAKCLGSCKHQHHISCLLPKRLKIYFFPCLGSPIPTDMPSPQKVSIE